MFSFKSSIKSSPGAKDSPNSYFMEESDERKQLNKLQEELTREKQEMRVLDEVEDLKRRTKKFRNYRSADQLDLADRIQKLEGELDAARDSERKLLLSLEAQTKQLEQTKVSLEEAKLEITSLQNSKKDLEALTATSSNPSREPAKTFTRRGLMSFSFANPSELETWSLQRELKLAMESEEKCKKAMDDLAIALKEQSTEAREAKAKLSSVQAELDNARTEVENLKASLAITEEKLKLAEEEAERLKLESDEIAAASKEKERGLIDCIKMFEDELTKGKEENDKLIESQRVIRDENSRLREMLKHAVGEANVARESLEIARVENSRLNEHIAEKESILRSMMQDYESLKVSEAASQSSLKELKDMIDAKFSSESTKTSAEASPRDIKRGVISEYDAYSDVDMGNPAKQKKKTIMRKFSDIMKKETLKQHSILRK